MTFAAFAVFAADDSASLADSRAALAAFAVSIAARAASSAAAAAASAASRPRRATATMRSAERQSWRASAVLVMSSSFSGIDPPVPIADTKYGRYGPLRTSRSGSCVSWSGPPALDADREHLERFAPA